MILVVGSTGLLGTEICRLLRNAHEPVRALVRSTADPAKRAYLEALGCQISEGDLKEPETLWEAFRNVEALVSTASSALSRQPGDTIATVDLEGQLTLCQAAARARVPRVVFASFRHGAIIRYPLTDAKREVERALAPLPATSIQASMFMEVWLSPALGFDYGNGRATIYGDGANPISWVSYRDVARFCVSALFDPAAGRVVEVGGPAALSPLEVVSIFEQESERAFEVQRVPEAALREQFDAATDPLQKSFAGLMLMYAHGDTIDVRPALRRSPGPLTSVRDYARRVLAGMSHAATA